MEPYSVLLRIEALETAYALDRQERESVFRFMRSLAENPFQDGDSSEYDRDGHLRQIKIVGTWAVVYHVDNADREVRILDVKPVDR